MGDSFILLPKAKDDLENIFSYIATELFHPEAALNLIHKFETKFNELVSYPYAYPKIESKLIYEIDLRKCVVDNYIVIYYYNQKENIIEIVRVIYSRVDYFNGI